MITNGQKNTVAIIQARMSSERLPGKVMAEIGGKPMLYHVVKRAERAELINLIVVATSHHHDDDVIENFCKENAVVCFRGSRNDVLDRYYQAARYLDALVIVRLTADCPLLDPGIIDKIILNYYEGDFDYVSNIIEYTYPDGLDTEVFSFDALNRAWREARLKSEREHVTPYLRNHPEIFRLVNISHTEDLSHLRWTVDEPQDMDFIRSVFAHMGDSCFGMTDTLNLLRECPELSIKNAGIKRNEGYIVSLNDDCVAESKGAV
jgi:spore coat polysaccharide biosynthesis protein SpsF